MQLNKSSWGMAKTSRNDKYDFWLENGATVPQAQRARDFGFKTANQYYQTLVGPKKSKMVSKQKWDDTSYFWAEQGIEQPQHKNNFRSIANIKSKEKNNMPYVFNPNLKWVRKNNKVNTQKTGQWKKLNMEDKENVLKWNEQAVLINRYKWRKLSKAEKLQFGSISSNMSHSAGFAAVYFHYVEGMSWDEAIEKVHFIDPVDNSEYE